MTVIAQTEDPITWGDVGSFHSGEHYRLYRKLGAHPVERDGRRGVRFAVWAPAAERVSVTGDFNGWNNESHPLTPFGDSGLHEGFVPDVGQGNHYKYHVRSRYGGYEVDKADPFGFHHETAPETGSIVWPLDYEWGDRDWMERRGERQSARSPISIYEVHLGSWQRGDGDRMLSYRESAPRLAEYCLDNGFTHVELLPITEHPFYGSWGYQTTGYFAPTSRYGTPQDFMWFVDHLHQRGIGVILDWVPSHFPQNEHGLVYFDGTHLFEPEDPRRGWHPEWSSYIFDYGRPEVRAFLISSALFWLDVYHIDGLRVDAVASMLYLDYARQPGEWVPNRYGGHENLDAVQFLRQLNEEIGGAYPDTLTIAEESTAWPLVSRPTWAGGLGFTMKWDMGWMNDTLSYFREDPVHRRYHHQKVTFRTMYAFSESFCLSISHDEVVHGKGSLMGKMPGDDWQKFANLRLLFGWQWAQPGKKLLFMGCELGQWQEWSHDRSLDWHLLDQEGGHRGVQRWVRDLNRLYREEPGLSDQDFSPLGFEWVDCSDADQSIVALLRRDAEGEQIFLAAFNFTPVPRRNYRLGVPKGGTWREVLNSDAEIYGGSGVGNFGGVLASPLPMHGRRFSVSVTLPPLGAVFLEHDPASDPLAPEGEGEA